MMGEILRQRRTKAGLSLRALASRLGIDPAYLSRVEKGTVPPSEQLLRGLSGALDWNHDELLLLAGRLPDSLRHFVALEPEKVTAALTGLAAMVVAERQMPYGAPMLVGRGEKAIEDGFPLVELSAVAEVESWRKEVYRPVYHLHKWWAQRLGSVFRAAILGATMPKGSAIMDLFYQPVRLPAPVVFDPFMGSGTTVGEAHKLGCTVIGRDINPVAYRTVRVALSLVSREKLLRLFAELENQVKSRLLRLYRSVDSEGEPCDVLYFFWAKILPCPGCSEEVEIRSSYVFAKHAYVKKFPRVQVLCPGCRGVLTAQYSDKSVECPSCQLQFDPHRGPARRSKACCDHCQLEFPIARTARSAGKPPGHKLYAKLVLRRDGRREYLPATDADQKAFGLAARRLKVLKPRLPTAPIQDGHNTRQVLSYGYTSWDQMFNERQQLALTILAEGIRKLEACPERDALMLLFSGALEFNNMFASYKGEGTGAVRHMFSHHVLKPERTPIEANLWGTPKSSGAFSTLFQSRLLRALDYQNAPFEVAVDWRDGKPVSRKVFGVSPPMNAYLVDRHPEEGLPAGAVYLSCGDSAATDIPNRSVDLIVTDPPFFDNVHYSELADFFYVWQQIYFDDGEPSKQTTTRRVGEVQDTDAEAFAEKLREVFRECHRVLKDDGLMVFSYHHSRDDGWSAVADAVWGAGFVVVQAQPVKAEMSVATPKSRARSPIDLDVLVVCRKRQSARSRARPDGDPLERAQRAAEKQILRFNRAGRELSENDVRVVLHSQLLVELSRAENQERARSRLADVLLHAANLAATLWERQEIAATLEATTDDAQLRLAL